MGAFYCKGRKRRNRLARRGFNCETLEFHEKQPVFRTERRKRVCRQDSQDLQDEEGLESRANSAGRFAPSVDAGAQSRESCKFCNSCQKRLLGLSCNKTHRGRRVFTTENTEGTAEGESGREAKGPKKNEVVFLRPILS